MLLSLQKYFKIKLFKIYLFRFILFLIQYTLFHPKHFRDEKLKKILVIRLKHLGDLILTLPILQVLRETYPNVELIVATGSWNSRLVDEFEGYIDRSYFYNVKSYCRSKNQIMKWRQKYSVLKQISGESADLVIDLDGSLGFLWLYLFKRIKYLSSIESLRFLQNLKQLGLVTNTNTNYNIHQQHELLNLAESLRFLGIRSMPEIINLKCRTESVQAVELFLKNLQLTDFFPIIGIQPTASTNEKFWSFEKFAALTEKLIEKYQAKIIFFSAPNEQEQIHAIQKQIPYKTYDATSLSMGEFIVAIKKCHLLICLDSFPQHVAYLQNVSTVVLYMTDNFQRWTPPNSDNFAVVYNKYGIEPGDVLEQIPKTFLSNYEMMQ